MIKSFVLTIMLVLNTLLHMLNAQIDHVEPPNWWIGMQNHNLQIMIHGSDIGETTPIINYRGVTIKKIHKSESKNYIFIDLKIEKHTKPGQIILQFEKYGKIIYSYRYSLLKRDGIHLKSRALTHLMSYILSHLTGLQTVMKKMMLFPECLKIV